MRQWERTRSNHLAEFQENGYDSLSKEWLNASEISTVNLRLTREQLGELTGRWEEFIDEYVNRYRGQNPPGSRPVQVHFNAFPVLDGDITPLDADKEA